MKPKIAKAIAYLQKFEGEGKCPMELLTNAKNQFKLTDRDIAELLTIY